MDFKFLKLGKKWVILAPRRAKRPDVAHGEVSLCPFCPGGEEKEVFRLESVRVLNNKFPFASIHEVIIHSQDHHKNFGELPVEQIELILKTYRQRYQTHKLVGQVYIFHNRGKAGGESLPHPHSQLAVVPGEVEMEMPVLNTVIVNEAKQSQEIASPAFGEARNDMVGTQFFSIFCPQSSQWPDEVWIAPKVREREFGDITDRQITDLADILTRLVHILDLRHGREFPFNFYISPGNDWYLRIIPRLKVLGGFELGTGIYINTQDPSETIAFIKEHFEEPDIEKIQKEHQAEYEKRV